MKRTLCSFVAAVVWAASAGAVPPVIPSPGPVIAVGANQVTMSGVTPGSRAILFSISQKRALYVSGYQRHVELLPPADALGNVVLPLKAIEPASIWCVADV